MHRHQSYFRRAATTGLLNSAASAVSVALLLPPLIARVGLDSYGFWSMLTLFVGLGSLLDLGLSKAIVYLVAGAGRDRGEVLSAALLVGGLASLTVAAAVMSASVLGLPLFGPAVAAQPGMSLWIAGCGGLILVCCVITTLLRSLLEAHFRLDIVNIGFAALTLLNYGVVLSLTIVTQDPRRLMLGTAGVFVVVLLAHAAVVARIAPLRPRRPTMQACRDLFRSGFTAYLADMPSVLLAPSLQYLFSLQAQRGSDYGIFDLALRIATLCATALGSLSSPYFAIVSAAVPESRSAVRQSIARHLRIMLLVALAGWVLFLLLGQPLLALLLRQPAEALYRTTLTMLSGAALLAALDPISRMLLGLGRRGVLLANRSAMLLATLGAAALLARLPPLDRFALAYMAGFLIAAAGLVVLNFREPWGRS